VKHNFSRSHSVLVEGSWKKLRNSPHIYIKLFINFTDFSTNISVLLTRVYSLRFLMRLLVCWLKKRHSC